MIQTAHFPRGVAPRHRRIVARHITTALSSTAAGDQHGAYLRWGDDLAIDVRYPSVTVSGRYQDFSVDLQLAVTRPVAHDGGCSDEPEIHRSPQR